MINGGGNAQETVADELEEGYRGEIWNPARGHAAPQKQGLSAARMELRTLVNECKARAQGFCFADSVCTACGCLACDGMYCVN
jgi:hypothetical protein